MPSSRSPVLSCVAVCGSLALLLPTTGIGAEEATVSGTLTANGSTVVLPHVYVYALEEGFYESLLQFHVVVEK